MDRMTRLVCTALLCIVLLRTIPQVQGTRQRPPLPYSTGKGRNALLGALSPGSTPTGSYTADPASLAAESRLPSTGGLGVKKPTRSQIAQTRIGGGTDAQPGEFPWIAALVQRGDGFVFCSAAVVAESWLLTAAHCVRPADNQYDVLVNKHLRDADPGEVRFNVIEVQLHPEYQPFSYHNDVALLRVDRSMVPSAQVIALPTTRCAIQEPASCLVGETGVIAGWGLLQGDTFQLPTVLQKGELPILDNRNCARRFARPPVQVEIFDSMLCAAEESGGVDTCQGDSGGPLVVSNGTSYTLEGVVSVGYGCGVPGYYGIYQRVASFTDWIESEQRAGASREQTPTALDEAAPDSAPMTPAEAAL